MSKKNDSPVVFDEGRLRVAEVCSLEAPLEAFGNVKLVEDFKRLSDQSVLTLAEYLQFPINAMDTKANLTRPVPISEIRSVVMFSLQYAWYQQIPGGVPQKVKENYDEKVKHFSALVDRIKEGTYVSETPAKAAKASNGAGARKANRVFRYALTTNTLSDALVKKIANEQTTNHDAIIVSVMQKHNPNTLEHIVEHVNNTGRYETKDPLPVSVRWHLNKLEKEGVIVASDVTPTTAPEPASAPAEAKAEVSTKPAPVVGTKSDKKAHAKQA